MQIAPLTAGGTTPERRLALATVDRSAARSSESAASAPRQPAPDAAMRGGLSTLDADLNRQVAAAQQALEYLDQLRSDLQGLKSALSGKLAERSASDADGRIADSLRRFAERWSKRAAATGNSLDGQLALAPAGEARQNFRARGLELANLRRGSKETLSVSVGGRQNVAVVLEAGLDDAAIVARLRDALAPAGIDVAKDAEGRLIFGAAEAAWPALRDSLAVKGAGQRFPAGQFSRVGTEPAPEAIRPQDWESNDPGALRRTLQEVLDALDLVRQAHEAISRAIAEAAHGLDAAKASAAEEWAASFAGEFAAMADRPRFQIFSAIAPALVAISRHRVVSLLRLG